MKHFFTFLILLTCSLAYNQTLSNKHDYFVQYNGSQLSKKIDGTKLKPIFGWFVLVMGFYIITKEVLF